MIKTETVIVGHYVGRYYIPLIALVGVRYYNVDIWDSCLLLEQQLLDFILYCGRVDY